MKNPIDQSQKKLELWAKPTLKREKYVLRKMARCGKSSAYSLSSLNSSKNEKNYESVWIGISGLQKLDLVTPVTKVTRGRKSSKKREKELLYQLNVKGIKEAILDPINDEPNERLAIEHVWDRILDLEKQYGESRENEFQEYASNLFTLYYEKVLKIPNEFIHGIVNNNILDITKKIYEIDYDFYVKIRTNLLKLYTDDIVNFNPTEESAIQMLQYNLIQLVPNNNLIRTTHFGLMLIFTHLLDYYLMPNSSANIDNLLERMKPDYNGEYAELSSLHALRMKNSFLFPLILKETKWNKLKQHLSESNLLSCFPIPQRLNEHQKKMYDIRKTESTPIEIIYHMEEKYAKNIWNEYSYSSDTKGLTFRFKELKDQVSCHFPSPGLGLIMNNPKITNSIQNVITMYFFVKLEEKIGKVNFSKLLEEDEDIRHFWNKWIQQLKYFQQIQDKEFQTYHPDVDSINKQEISEIENEIKEQQNQIEQKKIQIKILENRLKN